MTGAIPTAGQHRRPRVAVVMATDLGRSPRARLHVESLLAHGCDVTVIAAAGKPTPLVRGPHLDIVRVSLTPATVAEASSTSARILDWAVQAAQRFGAFSARVARALFATSPDWVLLVVPPVTPLIDVVSGYCLASGRPLVVDWHNFEAAMVALRLQHTGAPSGLKALATRAATAHERTLARGAALQLGVTDALVRELGADDRCVCFDDVPVTRPSAPLAPAAHLAARAARGLPAGPLLVMSSSFSLDDDIDFLVAALVEFRRASAGIISQFNRLRGAQAVEFAKHRSDAHVLLTGDGPRRTETLARIRAVGLAVSARYIDDDDYLATVSLCDVALCVHRSASGLDFPYKVRDAASAGVATVALDYGPVLRAGLDVHDVAAATPASFAAGVLALLETRPTVTVQETWAERWHRVIWPRVARLHTSSRRPVIR